MSSSNPIMLLKDFEVNQVNFEAINRNARNGKSIRLTYGPNKQPIRLQLPDIFIPFDIKQMPDDMRPGEFTYTFEAALQGYDEEGNKVRELYNKLMDLDSRILDICEERSLEWFGEKKRREVIQEFHRKLVRQNNPKFSPVVRVKIARINAAGEMPKVFEKSGTGQSLPVTVLTKGARAKLIVTIPSVWMVNKNFGVSLKLYQGCVIERPATMNNDDYAFKDDDDDDPSVPSQETKPSDD